MDPCPIRILMVTDGTGSYGDAEFGLSILVNILEESFDPKVRFIVTKAHRADEEGVDICHFRFDDEKMFDPGDHDQIWFFGVLRGVYPPLEQSELDVVLRFMECGKGVFATGDHEDLGGALCGALPRVRHMRKWFQIQGPLEAPPRDSERRHDTLRRGDDNIYSSNDERDDTPQIIFPKIYSHPSLPNVLYDCCPMIYPHPLLCGQHGILKFLPDHMHEGACYEPNVKDMCHVYTIDGDPHPEFPFITTTKRLMPEVIASARPPEPHTTFVPMARACHRPNQIPSFGAIGAYDGHLVSVGRVVVQSTFHHFINLNLRGFEESTDTVSPNRGRKAYKEIKNYFRNLGLWLAPSQVQRDVYIRAIWEARWTYPVNEELLSIDKYVGPHLPEYILQLGAMTRGTLDSIITSCLSLSFSLNLLRGVLKTENWSVKRRFLPDPWMPESAREAESEADHPIYPEALLNAVVGGAMLGIEATSQGGNREFTKRVSEQLPGVIQAGSQFGAAAFFTLMLRQSTRASTFIKDFAQVIQLT
jgi:hypothetical protein